MKSIKTLIADIKARLVDPTPYKAEDTKWFAERLATMMADRLARGPDKPRLRMSNLGTKCDRKLWYSINRPEWAEPIGPSARLKFLFGDIIEELVFFLAKASGHAVTGEQTEVDLYGVKGRLDGFIDEELVDVKSASSFGYKKFREHRLDTDDPFGYRDQLGGYGAATGKRTGHFVAVDKQLGHICLDTYSLEGRDYEKLVKDKREMLEWPQPPARAYSDEPDGRSGNRKLGVECSYCQFKFHCWPGLKAYAYAERPRFLTVVNRPPQAHIKELKANEIPED